MITFHQPLAFPSSPRTEEIIACLPFLSKKARKPLDQSLCYSLRELGFVKQSRGVASCSLSPPGHSSQLLAAHKYSSQFLLKTSLVIVSKRHQKEIIGLHLIPPPGPFPVLCTNPTAICYENKTTKKKNLIYCFLCQLPVLALPRQTASVCNLG